MDPYEQFLGLKLAGRRPDHYELLGIARSETDPEALLKATEHRLAQVSAVRSRQNSVQANRLMQEIVAARACLSSPDSRRAYDESLKPADLAAKPPAISAGSKGAIPPSIARLSGGKQANRRGTRRLLIRAVLAIVLVSGIGLALFSWLSQDVEQPETDSSPTEVAQAEPSPAADGNTPAPTEQPAPAPEQPDNDGAGAPPEKTAPEQPSPAEEQPEDKPAPHAPADELDRVALGRILGQSTVRVTAVYPGAKGTTGLGVVIHPSGLVATCCHLVAGASSVDVEFSDGSRLPVLGIRAMAPDKDLAILHVAIKEEEFQAIALADLSAKPQDTCFAVRFATPKHITAVPVMVQSLFKGTELNRRIPNIVKGNAAAFAPDLTCVEAVTSVNVTTSGGPVINARGELVAITMWIGDASSGTPVVVSALDLKPHAEQAIGAGISPLTKLDPRSVAGFDASQLRPIDVAQAWDSVTLPSGSVVDAKIGVVSDRDLKELTSAPKDSGNESIPSFFVHSFESGEVQGIYRHIDGKLHGTSAMLHKNGELKMVGEYDRGKRSGLLRYWSDDNRLVFSAQYKLGNENGVVCTYRDARPWLVQECENGRAKVTHLITFVEDAPVLATFESSELTVGTDAQLDEALANLRALKRSIGDDELLARRETSSWYNDTYKELQKQAIAARSTQIRAAQSKRHAQQAAAANEVINSLRRRHGMN